MINFDDLKGNFEKDYEFKQRTIDAIKEIQTQLFMFSKEFGNMLGIIGRLEDRVEELEKKIEWGNYLD